MVITKLGGILLVYQELQKTRGAKSVGKIWNLPIMPMCNLKSLKRVVLGSCMSSWSYHCCTPQTFHFLGPWKVDDAQCPSIPCWTLCSNDSVCFIIRSSSTIMQWNQGYTSFFRSEERRVRKECSIDCYASARNIMHVYYVTNDE